MLGLKFRLLPILILFYAASVNAVDLPTDFKMELKVKGLGTATSFDFAADNLIYVTSKEGVVYVVKNGVKQKDKFLDISDIVNDVMDRGLVEVAVDPGFPERPYLYLAYTLILLRYKV